MKVSCAKHLGSVLALGVCLTAGVAGAADDGWSVVSRSPVLIKTRATPGTSVKEVWAEATLDAEALDVQEAILATSDYPDFMPYVKEARVLVNEAGPNAYYSYTRLTLPVIGGRDYVVKCTVDERIKEPGKGTFRQRWEAAPDLIPNRRSVSRIRINQGSWKVTPKGEGKSVIVYSILTDPGGVPGFVVDMANRSGVTGTLEAVEKKAKALGQRRELQEKRDRAASQEAQRQNAN